MACSGAVGMRDDVSQARNRTQLLTTNITTNTRPFLQDELTLIPA